MDRLRFRPEVRLQKCSGTNLYSCENSLFKGKHLLINISRVNMNSKKLKSSRIFYLLYNLGEVLMFFLYR